MKIKSSQLKALIKEVVEQELEGPKSDIEYITSSQAESLIRGSKGSIFTVVFTKKDGTDRKMNARIGVKKDLKGGELKYDAKSKGLIVVYDIDCGKKRQSDDDKACYRMVNRDTIKSLRIGKNKYVINPDLPDTPTPQ